MRIIRAEIKKGVLEVLSMPPDVLLQVVDEDSGEEFEVRQSPQTGLPVEVILRRFEPVR
jgi:hypothetical protein